jgi:hypothetical protein
MSHANRKVIVILAARQDGIPYFAIHQPLEVRHAIWFLPPQYAHDALFGS